jgi:hypothetical protein
MTNYYNKSEFYSFEELTEVEQLQVVNDFCFDTEELQAETQYVKLEHPKRGAEFLPLSNFMRTSNNNFTHGIFSTSAFDGYFITLSNCGSMCVIAHKYF